MLEFIVLGLVPGTHFQIDFWQIFSVAAVIFIFVALIILMKFLHKTAQAALRFKPDNTISLLSERQDGLTV
jgi:hypothetical protein